MMKNETIVDVQVYGKVVDVFVPNLKSKAGKRYAFVRFIKVDDMDRLVGNLCTLWVGRFHLHANDVRYERPSKPTPSVNNPSSQTRKHNVSYATAVKNTKSSNRSFDLGPPAVVLDDTCVNDGDFSRHVMGRVKDLNSIPNLKMILTKEGLREIKLSYLGGEERIVWVDIEGIPLSVWSHATFFKIGKKWGDVMNIEESTGSLFARKRLCIKTNLAENILETFKVIFKGKIYMVRAKELFTWTPCFMEYNDTDYTSDDESFCGVKNKPTESPLDEDVLKDNSRAVHSTAKDPIVSEPFSEFSTTFHARKTLNGGSILDVLDNIIKLDRFLISDGIFSAFPAITVVCLDRHLSDHRPIILHEIHTDFSPTPFRFYHSWFKREGFESMVEQAGIL
nr:hypothetical protein [Tanacetum cinerariifolium]